jgi:hypothetical protein
MVMLEYKKDLKQQSKRNTLSDVDRLIAELELADIVKERRTLQDAVPTTKNEHCEAKKQFAEEKKKPENGKVFGQPINAKIDDVLKQNGIDRAAMFGSTIEGNGSRKLMENCDAIITEMEEYVLGAPTRIAGTDAEIRHVGKAHRDLLTCLDGFFSFLWTKRFHLTPEIVEKGIMFRGRVLAHKRYLGMNMTTKSHLMEDHAVEQQQELNGFGDLGEDFGEQNHQDQAKANRRLGCFRNFAVRKAIKSREEVQIKDEKVQAKILEIKGKRKRGLYKGTEARHAARRQRRLDARQEVLDWPSPEGKMRTLRELHMLQLKEG